MALEHYAYFPGTVYTAAVWRLLPEPFDDYRLFVLLATLGLLAAVLLFPGRSLKLAAGAVLGANPLAVRGAWFSVADAPSILLVGSRSRSARGPASSAAAACRRCCPPEAVRSRRSPLRRGADPPRADRPRRTSWKAAACFGGVLLAGFLPFLIFDAAALYDDTIAYGAETHRIIGYGVAGILVGSAPSGERTILRDPRDARLAPGHGLARVEPDPLQ